MFASQARALLKTSIQSRVSIVVPTLLAILVAQAVSAANDDEGEIRAAVKRFDAAFNSHKTDDFLALYTANADSIYFEEVMPLQIKGRDAFRKYVDSAFTQASSLHQETTVEKVIADRNVAAAACIVRASWTDATGEHSQVGRFTMVFLMPEAHSGIGTRRGDVPPRLPTLTPKAAKIAAIPYNYTPRCHDITDLRAKYNLIALTAPDPAPS